LLIEFDQVVPAFVDPAENNDGTFISSKRGYKDVWQFRLGGEYSVMENLDIRAGIAYDQNPIPDKYLDPTLPDSDRLLFSGGLTYKATDFLDVDLAYIFIRANERKSTTAVHGLDGVYNTYANLPSLGITMKF
jgi:long-chain fatty acid transport protein